MVRIISSGRRVTLKAIAEQVGCAVSVVSTVLNDASGSTRVGADMRKRIETVAKKLGYRPNYHARSLRTGKANAVGLLLIRGEHKRGGARFWQPVFAAASDELLARNYQVICLGSHKRNRIVEDLEAAIEDNRIDALITPGFGFSQAVFKRFAELPVPVVVVEGRAIKGCGHVQLDDASGIASAVDHLQQLGHRELAYCGADDGASGSWRRQAFIDRCRSLGLKGECLDLPVDLDERGAADATVDVVSKRFKRKQVPTGLVCYNEHIAIGAYEALGRLGLTVPDDVSVIGFDDIHGSAVRPAMTVVSHLLEELGIEAAKHVLELIDHPDQEPRQIDLPAELVIRESTAKLH